MATKRLQKSDDFADRSAELAALREELSAIKRLLMVLLTKLGADSSELGVALGVSSSRVRDMLPMRKISRLTFPETAE